MYNLRTSSGGLALPRSVKHWSLTTLREKLIKIGAKVVRHAKYVTFQMAEVAVPCELFAAILERIQRFGVPRSSTAVGTAWLTRRPNEGWRLVGAEVDAARKRAGIVVPEASGPGLAP